MQVVPFNIFTGMILGLQPADERRCYNVVSHWLGANLESAMHLEYINKCYPGSHSNYPFVGVDEIIDLIFN